ncbi:MAG TPA: ribonuclease HII [Candidatus Sulfotelmatobacter sp.]|jgi:ribonuclease HII|nr:ribonuclease HII [Candidatus Sulfotelmatobacter sp.]
MKRIQQTKPTFEYESKLWDQGFQFIAGVDEVGRGCFAGPVVAAAVILPSNFSITNKIDDSKKLSSKVRKELAVIIKEYAIAYSIAEVSVSIINQIGIGKATQKAFRKTIKELSTKPDFILIDAFYIENLTRKNQKPIVHGDGKSISIAAASILAKVYRDELMQRIHQQYVAYDFFTNKGYGTKKHREAIAQYGLCELHRTSFDLEKFL